MTFEEANKLVKGDSYEDFKNGLEAFETEPHFYLCFTCKRRNECNAFCVLFSVGKCNFYEDEA